MYKPQVTSRLMPVMPSPSVNCRPVGRQPSQRSESASPASQQLVPCFLRECSLEHGPHSHHIVTRWDRFPSSACGRCVTSRAAAVTTADFGVREVPKQPSLPAGHAWRRNAGGSARPSAARRRRCTSPPRPWSWWGTGRVDRLHVGPGILPIEAPGSRTDRRPCSIGSRCSGACPSSRCRPARLKVASVGQTLPQGGLRAVVAQHQDRLGLPVPRRDTRATGRGKDSRPARSRST